MTERGGMPPLRGEIQFSEDELSEMNAVVIGDGSRKRNVLKVPFDDVPRAEEAPVHATPTLRPTVKQKAFNPLDLLVDAAFVRDANPSAPWAHGDDDGIEPADGVEVAPPSPMQSLPPFAPTRAAPARAQAQSVTPTTLPMPTVAPGPNSTLPSLSPAAPLGARLSNPSLAPTSGAPRQSTRPMVTVGAAEPGASRSGSAEGASVHDTTPSMPAAAIPDEPVLLTRTIPSMPVPPIPLLPPSITVDPTRARVTAPSMPVAVPVSMASVATPASPPTAPSSLLTTPSMPVVTPAIPSAPSMPVAAPSMPISSSAVPSLPTAPSMQPGSPAMAVAAPPSLASLESRPRTTAPSMPASAPPSLTPTAPVALDARLKTTPSMPAAPPPLALDARLKTTPSMPALSPTSLPPLAPADGRPRITAPTMPAVAPPPPGNGAAARTSLPPRPTTPERPAEDAVFASSPPPDFELLRFTTPDPPTFRVIVAPITPTEEDMKAALAAPVPAAAHAAQGVAAPPPAEPRDEAELLESAEIEEVSDGVAHEAPRAAAPARPMPPVPPPPASLPPRAPAAVESSAEPEPRGRRRRRVKAWFEDLFDEDYLLTLPPIAPEQTAREVGFLVDALKLSAPAALLDLGCGVGRHAVELAGRGHEVTGIDLALPLVIRAADAARRAGVNVNFVHGDMRELAFEAQFDAAYCWFTSFGYFDDDTNRAVAAAVHRSLKPGGRFLVDIVNRDFLLSEVPARLWWQAEGCMVLEELDFNYYTSRLQNRRSVVFEDARQLEFDVSIRAYSLHEIGKLLHASGFRVIEVSGSPHTRGRFFGGESRQILIVAEKK